MKSWSKLATLAILIVTFTIARAAQQSQPQSSQAPEQSQTAQPPPHVDAEPDPASRSLEKEIQTDLKQDPHMAYSKVTVHADDKQIVLSGTVLTTTAKDQAGQIAESHAGGRKINNKIRVNPNTNPGPGI